MDLSSATPYQRQIVTTLDAPLSVAAGAGSGKTFTLTRRIGHALLGEKGIAPFIDSIDEVLAITYTNAGASEMKSRIRLLLQEEGLKEEALKVEDAWISTIHGMCARILREQALEIGLDPAFIIVEGDERVKLWDAAVEAVLDSLTTSDDPSDARLLRLFLWYSGSDGTGISRLAEEVRSAALGLPDGFESLVYPRVEFEPVRELRIMMKLVEEFISRASVPDFKFGAHGEKYLAQNQKALDNARAYLDSLDQDRSSFGDVDFDIKAYLNVLFSFSKTSKTFHEKDDDAAFFNDYRQTYAHIVLDAQSAASCVILDDLIEVTRRIDGYYRSFKGVGRLDNTDLLVRCNEVLETYPDIRDLYRSRFRAIMVDEFQDTDLLQVAIIDKISRDHGANVMTVGDAQQSIYRFRGADVEVFFAHRDDQLAKHETARAVSLPDNFRSHADVLAFVDAIFSRHEFFGEEFLSLQPKGEVNAGSDPVFASIPRIEIDVFESRQKKSSVEDLRVKASRAIARRFASMRDAGASPSDMVILLGKMTNAAVYSKALTEAGFESIIAGGSVFASRKEVKLFDALLTALAHREDSIAFYTVLESPLFALSDSALYALARVTFDDESVSRPYSLSERFWHLVSAFDLQGEKSALDHLRPFGLASDQLREIARVLTLFARLSHESDRRDLTSALRRFLIDTGWLYRLEQEGAEGLSVAANVFKALGFVEDWQREGLTKGQIAQKFSSFLEETKQSPGVLSTLDTNFVRIMTIHSSKGLEFDHVAVAEIDSGSGSDQGSLQMNSFSGALLARIKPPIESSLVNGHVHLDSPSSLHVGAREACVSSPLTFKALLDERNAEGALGDAQRLLYVALTRAARSLCLCLTFQGKSDFTFSKETIFSELHDVFRWDHVEEPKRSSFDFGGSAPALLHHEVLLEPVEKDSAEVRSSSEFLVPVLRPSSVVECSIESERHDVVSYSALSSGHSEETLLDGWSDRTCSSPEEAVVETEERMLDTREEPFIDDLSAVLKQESATALGTAFHRLAQRAIESRRFVGAPAEVSEEAFAVQVASCDLSPDQEQRLRIAIDRWFGSDLCARFMACDQVRAEVPFMLEIEREDARIFLEGEIDGLAFDPSDPAKHALFIDYKTGGSDQESEAHLYEKHLLQAQCYALALMRQGFDEVEAYFIRVERASSAEPTQPQVVPYTFAQSDRDALEEAIMAAYRVTKR